MLEIILPLLLLFSLFLFIYVFRTFSICPYTCRNFSKDSNIKSSLETEIWAEDNQFHLQGYYKIREGLCTLFAVAWQNKEVPCYLTFWRMNNQEQGGYLDFDTRFENGRALTTTNCSSANLLPRPKQFYKQNFPEMNIDELYIKHLDAIAFLMQEGNLVPEALSDYVTSTTQYQNQERRYAWRHWYNGLLVFYFMLFRNRRFRGKTIQQQHTTRLIGLPIRTERDKCVDNIERVG